MKLVRSKDTEWFISLKLDTKSLLCSLKESTSDQVNDQLQEERMLRNIPEEFVVYLIELSVEFNLN